MALFNLCKIIARTTEAKTKSISVSKTFKSIKEPISVSETYDICTKIL